MRSFDVRHHDPAPLARSASVRSPRERDDAVSARARSQEPAERLHEGLALSRFAARLTTRSTSR
jgi:hypothetical protein